MAKTTTNDRLTAVYCGFLIVLMALWARCAWLQVVGRGRLARIADAQHWTSRPIVAARGAMLDRAGRILAISARAPSVLAVAKGMNAKDRTAQRVAQVLGSDPKAIRRRLAKEKRFVWVARQVSPEFEAPLIQMRRDGIGIVEEGKRLYPQGQLAAHLLGFVNVDQRGLEGLELAYDGVLRGRKGWISTLRDAKGDQLVGPWTARVQPTPGDNLVLTIDSVVQAAAEDALSWGIGQFHAKGGTVIVMDPPTGEVLAIANYPEYDPNQPGRLKADTRRLRAITDLFEPGSVFKVVTAAALLEEGLVTPDERVFCEEGSFATIGHHILHDHRPHGWLTFHEVVQYSSNIGTAKMAQRLSPEQLYSYIRAFGFGQKTGIEFPGEVSGIIPPPAKWSKLSPYIIPIGQEVATTPIQLAVMMSVIANGGYRVYPSVVREVQTSDGVLIRSSSRPAPLRILHPETVEKLSPMLVSVVESGTGQLAKVQGLTVAGKTGTAQKLEPNGHYSHSRFVASFVGYGPVPDPRFVIVVSLDEPHPLYFGGTVSAPIFARVVERLSSYWGLKAPGPAPLMAKSDD